MSFLSGPDDVAPLAVQPRAWNVIPGAIVSAAPPPPSGFVTLVSINTGGANEIPLGPPLTKTTNPIAGFANLISNELVPAAAADSWYYDATNAYPGIQWVRWTTGDISTLGTGDCGGMLSVRQDVDCQGYFFTSAGNLMNNIALIRYLGGYGLIAAGTEPYAPDTSYFAWFNPATGLIQLYRGVDNTGVLLLSFVDFPPLFPDGTPGFELFNGSLAAWSAGIFIP